MAIAAPPPSSPAVRRVMQGNRGRDTRPEQKVRSLLHRRGFRFRKHVRPISSSRCTADFVFATERVAVFIDGCFWHGCPEHGRRPKSNTAYWEAKFARNRTRDARFDAELAARGWLVIRAWEHEDPQHVAKRIEAAVTAARAVEPA